MTPSLRTAMSDEDYRGLSRVHLELKCGILEIERRSAKQESEEIKNFLFRRVADLAANEAITEPAARAPPVASGSGQLVPAPALPGPSERRGSAALGSMRDREPGVERSAHTRTRRAYAGSARPTTYVNLPSSSCRIDVLNLSRLKPFSSRFFFLSLVITRLDLVWQGPAPRMPLTLRVRPWLSLGSLPRQMQTLAIAFTLDLQGSYFFVKPVFIPRWQ